MAGVYKVSVALEWKTRATNTILKTLRYDAASEMTAAFSLLVFVNLSVFVNDNKHASYIRKI